MYKKSEWGFSKNFNEKPRSGFLLKTKPRSGFAKITISSRWSWSIFEALVKPLQRFLLTIFKTLTQVFSVNLARWWSLFPWLIQCTTKNEKKGRNEIQQRENWLVCQAVQGCLYTSLCEIRSFKQSKKHSLTWSVASRWIPRTFLHFSDQWMKVLHIFSNNSKSVNIIKLASEFCLIKRTVTCHFLLIFKFCPESAY